MRTTVSTLDHDQVSAARNALALPIDAAMWHPAAVKTPAPDTRETVTIPQPLGLFAGDLLLRADEFVDAFERLEVATNARFLHAGFYLLSHSVELGLKAFLAANGLSKRTLSSRQFGHDLTVLEAAARGHGLGEVEDLDNLVWHLNVMNGDHALRYPAGYFETVPAPGECLEVARALLLAIRSAVQSARLSDSLQLSGDSRYEGKRIEWAD